MKIYTKTGDAGMSSLIGGERVNKDHERLKAFGALDELNAAVGLLLAHGHNDSSISSLLPQRLEAIQNQLFVLGSHLACADSASASYLPPIEPHWIADLEHDIDWMTAALPALKNFILPGGSMVAAQCHLARTICRRAERDMTVLKDDLPLLARAYINRLSDYFFVLARWLNHQGKYPDKIWQK